MDDGAPRNDLFRRLDGLPAQIMVALGLVLALAAPVIPALANARRAAAEAELDKGRALRELEIAEFEEEQARPPSDGASALTEEQRAEARKKFDDELDARYDLAALEREAATARADAVGVRAHLYLHWLGRVLLLLGLLILTVNALGTRQKVLVAVLLLVLFGSLSGIALDVGANVQLGGGGGAVAPPAAPGGGG